MTTKDKKYYWIKLRTDFFSKEEIDFLLSQENGCKYIVLYLMLCLNTANKKGKLYSKLGDVFIPYDINKIVRDTKYFDYDTVVVAFKLFEQLGLIVDSESFFKINNFEELVGCESASAERVRKYRKNKLIEDKKLALQCNTDVTNMKQNCNNDVTQEIEIEKDIDIEIDI